MKAVIEYLDSILSFDDKVVISLSGGPDSMCLLSLLIPFIEKKSITLIAAHVNHKVRKESEEEEQFVKNYCLNHNVIFELLTIDNYNNKQNFHDEARVKRYNFLDSLMEKYHAKYLFTAHHGDDLMETILMRIDRGSILTGYAGFKKEMQHHNYMVVRPLIELTKQDLENHNKKNNIPYRIDQTNKLNIYKRNWFRNKILPLLKNENKDIHKKFYKYSKELYLYDEYINNLILDKKIIVNSKIYLPKFNLESDFIKRKILEYYIKCIQQNYDFYMTDKVIEEILKSLKNNKANKMINLPDGFIGYKEYEWFYINRQKEDISYDIILDKKFENNDWLIETNVTSDDESNYTFRFLSKEVKLPLHVRSRKNKDVIEVKNLNGSKKIKDLMIDAKIPLTKRNSYPLITDNNNIILGVPGIKKSKFNKKISEKYDIIVKCKEK